MTHIAQISDDLPNSRLIKPGVNTAILPQEPRQVAQFTQLGANEQPRVFFPTVGVRQHIRVFGIPFSALRDDSTRQVLQDLNFLSKAQSKNQNDSR
jgi:hypothetical protein